MIWFLSLSVILPFPFLKIKGYDFPSHPYSITPLWICQPLFVNLLKKFWIKVESFGGDILAIFHKGTFRGTCRKRSSAQATPQIRAFRQSQGRISSAPLPLFPHSPIGKVACSQSS
jgi:hypothetical protein